MLEQIVWDDDRKRKTNIREVYFYPFWDEVEKNHYNLRKLKNVIWKESNKCKEIKVRIIYTLKRLVLRHYSKYRLKKKKNRK